MNFAPKTIFIIFDVFKKFKLVSQKLKNKTEKSKSRPSWNRLCIEFKSIFRSSIASIGSKIGCSRNRPIPNRRELVGQTIVIMGITWAFFLRGKEGNCKIGVWFVTQKIFSCSVSNYLTLTIINIY